MRTNQTETGVQTTNEVEESAKKSDKKRSPIGATKQNILDFVMERELHECDAIKVAMRIVMSGTKVGNISEHDATILNLFMNEGLKPGEHNTEDTVIGHRQLKAYRLADVLGDFLEQKKMITVMSARLMLFASTAAHVKGILCKLNPVVLKADSNTADTTDTNTAQSGTNTSDTMQTDTKQDADQTSMTM